MGKQNFTYSVFFDEDGNQMCGFNKKLYTKQSALDQAVIEFGCEDSSDLEIKHGNVRYGFFSRNSEVFNGWYLDGISDIECSIIEISDFKNRVWVVSFAPKKTD